MSAKNNLSANQHAAYCVHCASQDREHDDWCPTITGEWPKIRRAGDPWSCPAGVDRSVCCGLPGACGDC